MKNETLCANYFTTMSKPLYLDKTESESNQKEYPLLGVSEMMKIT